MDWNGWVFEAGKLNHMSLLVTKYAWLGHSLHPYTSWRYIGPEMLPCLPKRPKHAPSVARHVIFEDFSDWWLGHTNIPKLPGTNWITKIYQFTPENTRTNQYLKTNSGILTVSSHQLAGHPFFPHIFQSCNHFLTRWLTVVDLKPY